MSLVCCAELRCRIDSFISGVLAPKHSSIESDYRIYWQFLSRINYPILVQQSGHIMAPSIYSSTGVVVVAGSCLPIEWMVVNENRTRSNLEWNARERRQNQSKIYYANTRTQISNSIRDLWSGHGRKISIRGRCSFSFLLFSLLVLCKSISWNRLFVVHWQRDSLFPFLRPPHLCLLTATPTLNQHQSMISIFAEIIPSSLVLIIISINDLL